jgi:hypothetical protein
MIGVFWRTQPGDTFDPLTLAPTGTAAHRRASGSSNCWRLSPTRRHGSAYCRRRRRCRWR